MGGESETLIIRAIDSLGDQLGRELREVKDRVGKLEQHVATQNGRLYSVETQQKIDAALATSNQQRETTVQTKRAWLVPTVVGAVCTTAGVVLTLVFG